MKLIVDKNRFIFVNIVILLVAITAIVLGGYFYYQLRILKTDPQSIVKKESDELVLKVSKIYLLPTGEDPTIATISDPEALKSQSFFSRSEKGDKVLIYSKSSKAILYRPNINKVIDTAPISDNSKTINPNISNISSTPNLDTNVGVSNPVVETSSTNKNPSKK